MNGWTAIILAEGTDICKKSNCLNPTQEACGKALINWVADAATEAEASKLVVLSRDKDSVKGIMKKDALIVERTNGQGLGSTVMDALSAIKQEYVVILCGNTPLIKAQTLKQAVTLMCQQTLDALAIAAEADDPTEHGRLVSKDDVVEKIDKHCMPEERLMCDIDKEIYVFSVKVLREALGRLNERPEAGEYCLADVIELLREGGGSVERFKVADFEEIMCVNNHADLARAEALLRRRINLRHMYQGVTMTDPERTYIDDAVTIGKDTVLLPGTILKGATVIGQGCTIGPETILTDCKIGDETSVMKTVGIKASVGENTQIGPFAYLRPDTYVGNACRIGDFVELKNSTIGNATKVSHLTYVGDSDVGERVNFGCGTVTVNYDGSKKYRTTIGNDVFVGCNSNLVAPVTLADGAYTAAGSTITDDVPERALAIARARQVLKERWNDRRDKH